MGGYFGRPPGCGCGGGDGVVMVVVGVVHVNWGHYLVHHVSAHLHAGCNDEVDEA